MSKLRVLHIPLNFIDDGLELIIEAVRDAPLFDSPEFEKQGEARYQIMEGCFYDYEIRYANGEKDNPWQLRNELCVKTHRRHSNLGTLAPNIYVGTLSIDIVNSKKDEKFRPVFLEVRSTKSDYRTDYRDMLEFITERCTELLMQSDSSVFHNFAPDFKENSESLYQKFSFIRSVIGSEEFNEAVHRIVTNPATQWKETSELKDIRSTKQFTNKNIRQFISGSNRTELTAGHFLNNYRLSSLPLKIESSRKIDSVDTSENRFIKHALQIFSKFCSDIHDAQKAGIALKSEADLLIRTIENHLCHSVFKEISRPTTLKLNSPLLQRKEGYREVLRAWLMFDLAAKLIWSGGDDVYQIGKKDIAVLYEYWLFFKLLELFEETFQLTSKPVEELIEKTDNGLNIRLKQGTHIALSGVYNQSGRKLNVRFNYNRSFDGKNDYPDSGSWTTTLRPDYTLSIWPTGIKEEQAEKEELIVHIHFDAKYKVENFADFLNQQSDDELLKEKSENRKGIYKNADLLKMHAYKDAIRRTGGAYVLYPGIEKTIRRGFHEIVPGLGAFPVRPSKIDSGTTEIKAFITDVISHFINRASQRERLAFRTYDIFKDKPANEDILHENLPEAFGVNRMLLPSEVTVLVGYYKNEQFDWIVKSGLYNARAEDDRGSLRLGPGETGAKYLLLHGEKELQSGKLFKIVETGPRVFSKSTLLKNKYPTVPSQEYYLVYKVSQFIEKEFENRKWDISKLEKYRDGRASVLPFAVTLSQLLKAEIK